MDEIVIRLYFVSGKEVDVHFEKHKFDELVEYLKHSWEKAISIGKIIGVNFNHVEAFKVIN